LALKTGIGAELDSQVLEGIIGAVFDKMLIKQRNWLPNTPFKRSAKSRARLISS